MPGLVLTAGGLSVGLTGPAPNAPGVVAADPTGETTATVTWANDAVPPGNATRFDIAISDDDGETWGEPLTAAASALSKGVTGLTGGADYLARVRSHNAWGDSVWVVSQPFTTPSAGPPAAPTNLQANVLSSGSAGLSWTDNSDNDDGFKVEWDTVNTFDADPQITQTSPHFSLYTVEGLASATQYFAHVRATNASGDSDWSNVVSFTTDAAGSAVFSLTAVADATAGITSTLSSANWTHASATWWPWTLRAHRFERTGNKGVLIVHHSDYGGRLYDGDGAFGFTNETASYGVSSPDMSDAVGGYLQIDLNHDGYGDLAAFSTNSMLNWLYDEGDGTLDSAAAPWNFEGPSAGIHPHLMREVSDKLEIEAEWWTDWPTALTFTRGKWTYNGTTYIETKDTSAGPPSGIPSGTLDEMETYLDDGSHVAEKRFIKFEFIPFDFDLDGTADDLIISLTGGYGGANRGWYLESDGAGGYIDRTSAWGLPDTGYPLIVRQKEFGRPFDCWPADASWHDFTTAAKPDLFLANIPGGGDFGHFRWNGSAYAKITSDLTDKLGLDDSYQKRLYGVDLTNSGHLDLILSRPRQGYCYVFLNDGSGNFTQYTIGRDLRHWDSDGLLIEDFNGNGLPDLILGGDGGTDSGVTSANNARCLSIWQNATTDAGNYLGILIRRTGREATNYFGVGSKIEVFEAGQSFSAASLIRRWYARPDGMPLIFGVGNEATVDYRVTWPDASTTSATAVSTNQTVTVTG